MKEINLFETYLAVPQKNLQFARRTRVITIVALIAYCLFLAGVFSYWLILKNQSSSLSEKIEAQRQEIANHQKVETLHVLVKQRLAALTPLLSQETLDYRQILEELDSITPEGIAYSDFDFEISGDFTCSAKAENAVILADFLERFSAKEDVFPADIEVSSVNRSGEGGYSVTLSFNAQN